MKPVAFRHVIFDLDGTLIDSRADLVAAVNHVLATMGLPALPFETACSYVGEGARRLMQRALGAENEGRIDVALSRFLDYYGAHLLDRTLPYHGVGALLADLRRRDLSLSVLSNKPERLSRAILTGLDLLQFFIAVLGPESAGARKPDPAGVLRLMTSAGARRDETIVVGDSDVDRQTAAAAGVAFCGVAWGIRPAELRAAGARIIDRPAELLFVVEQG